MLLPHPAFRGAADGRRGESRGRRRQGRATKLGCSCACICICNLFFFKACPAGHRAGELLLLSLVCRSNSRVVSSKIISHVPSKSYISTSPRTAQLIYNFSIVSFVPSPQKFFYPPLRCLPHFQPGFQWASRSPSAGNTDFTLSNSMSLRSPPFYPDTESIVQCRPAYEVSWLGGELAPNPVTWRSGRKRQWSLDARLARPDRT